MANLWSTSELKILRTLYPVGGTQAVFKVLGKRHTAASIKTTAWRLGIQCNAPIWKLREINSSDA
jgi:hypothetical protein